MTFCYCVMEIYFNEFFIYIILSILENAYPLHALEINFNELKIHSHTFFTQKKTNTIQEYNETFPVILLMANKYLGNFVLFLPTKVFISFPLTRGLLDYTSKRNAQSINDFCNDHC